MDLEAMIEAKVLADRIERAEGSGAGVVAAVDHPVDAGVDEGSRAHRAGLEGDVRGEPVEAPTPTVAGGLTEGEHLGVRGGVFEEFAEVVGPRDHEARTVDEDASDGNLSPQGGNPRLGEGEIHEAVGLVHRASDSRRIA